jgi:hypothetical protein
MRTPQARPPHVPEVDVSAQPGLRSRRGKPVPGVGERCVNAAGNSHYLDAPADDASLQQLARWFARSANLSQLIGDAIEDAMFYILDGWRTHRFDFADDTVDSDERRSLGTKLQYHVIENLDLKKTKHPDTEVEGIGLEIKGTIGSNWAIPKEGQCGLTLLIQVDVDREMHSSRLMRTHRSWLRDRPNRDGKRGVASRALTDYSIRLYEPARLRPNPLKRLTESQKGEVLGKSGQERRFQSLFHALPETVIQRAAIQTIGANRADPLRRVRGIRKLMESDGFALLCGTWRAQSAVAARLGFDLTGDAWVAVPWASILGFPESAEAVAQIGREPSG